MRILIAEDDQVLADGLLRTLRSSGAVVSHVANGSEADTALLTSSEFDLLILDLGLPKVHGLEVLKRLRPTRGILLVEHDMDAVFRIADRITVMVNGSVVATGTPDQIRNDPVVRTAYLGEEEHA